MAHRCLMLLGVVVLGGVFALATFGCASTAPAAGIQRNAGEEQAKPKVRRLVLQLATNETGLHTGSTAAFIYNLKTEKASVEDVLAGCGFFNSLDRLLLYAEQEGWGDELEFDAVAFLSNGPGCFLDFAKDKRQAQSKTIHIRPKVSIASHFSVGFVSKMKYGTGAILWESPSGVAPSEGYVLRMGSFVSDYERFMKEYGDSHKKTPWLFLLDGKTLK